VDYNDAVKYNNEGNTTVFVFSSGYVEDPAHAPVLPANTIIRGVGATTQYL
jgi:hypothetical protein